MTISDWMEATPTDWIDRALPGWRDWSYGDLLRTSPTQWWTGMVTPWSAQTAWPAARPAHRPRHHRHHHRHGCGCGRGHEHHHRPEGCARCGPEPCECFCCLGDVDLAVYARVGERRVVPITVENERRREKTVTLELSEWTTRGGNPGQVRTDLLEPKAFTVAPCGEQSVVLVVDVGTPEKTPGRRSDGTSEEGRKLPDVDGCEVVTADLRLVGCDHRPIRIAVAILPRDCDPYTVGCGCTCC
jgi:hypothetical protein